MVGFRCEICHIYCKSLTCLEKHTSGKKHATSLQVEAKNKALAARSVFLKGFKGQIPSQTTFVDDIENSFGKETIKILPRISSYQSFIKKAKHCDMDMEIIEDILEGETDFDKQVVLLVNNFIMSKEKVTKRLELLSKLGSYLQTYFNFKINITAFGSIISGLATSYSDIDATILFNDSDVDGMMDMTDARSEQDMLNCNGEAFLESKIELQEFLNLSNVNKIKVVCKIISHIRKNHGIVSETLYALDKKVPLVQLSMDKKFVLDLSCGNKLGVVKFQWFSDLIRSDETGTCFKFIFALRLWASCNDMFKVHYGEKPRSALNTYIITLLGIYFLQQKKYIPMNPLNDSLVVENCNCGFQVNFYQFPKMSLSTLFREFFVFVILKVSSDKVLCIKDGTSYTIAQFDKINGENDRLTSNFMKVMNMQDPIEESHNVSKNVSEKHWKLFRTAILRSICKIKNGENFLLILDNTKADHNHSNEKMVTNLGKNELICEVPVPAHVNQDAFYVHINDIFEMVLLFDPVIDEDYMDTIQTDQSVCGTTGNDGQWERTFKTSHNVWKGRRMQRRSLTPVEGEHMIAKEKRVTRAILEKYALGEENMEPELRLELKFTAAFFNGNYSFYCQEPRIPDSQMQQFRELQHFLKFFIPNVMSTVF
uniref:NTP_transf_2 domain-containing protein n=1 Tax=Rhabditophanes sp. KR3021 TaxID=114890 RepID=A0AC35U9U7_9BILA